MPQVETKANCKICGSKIVAEVETLPTIPFAMMPLGPGSRGCFETRVLSFHCSAVGCALMYHYPPGQPDAAKEILSQFARVEDEDAIHINNVEIEVSAR